MIGKGDEYEKMADTERELWWYKILHLLTYRSIENRFGSDRTIQILDMGCGTGGLMLYLKTKGYENIKGFDISEDAVRICTERNLEVEKGDLLDAQSLIAKSNYQVIISHDTLCYFDLKQAQKIVLVLGDKLTTGGILLMNLPALQAFGGIHDKAVGIVRRFNFADVGELNVGSRLGLDSTRFWPFILTPLIFIKRFVQRLKMKKRNYEVTSDVEMPNGILNTAFFLLVKMEFSLLRSGLFGSSLYVVFVKE